MKKFELDTIYPMHSVCDHNCIWAYVVTARTAQTVTLFDGKKFIKRRIAKKDSELSGAEIVYPLGRYSMAPVLKA